MNRGEAIGLGLAGARTAGGVGIPPIYMFQTSIWFDGRLLPLRTLFVAAPVRGGQGGDGRAFLL